MMADRSAGRKNLFTDFDRLREDFGDPDHRVCHWCSKRWDSLEDLLAAFQAGQACVQAVTGRLFCLPECHQAYLRSEGLA